MKITYIGNDSECSTKVCNYLSDLHKVTLITDKTPIYETDCEVIVKNDLWVSDLFKSHAIDTIIYNCANQNYDLLNKWLSNSNRHVQNFIIVTENEFSSDESTVAIEGLLKEVYSSKGKINIYLLNISPLYGSVTVPHCIEETVQTIIRNNVIKKPEDFGNMCDALHIDDFCLFIGNFIEQIETIPVSTINVRSGYSFSPKSLFEKFAKHYPQAIESFDDLTSDVSSDESFHLAKWAPKHSFLEEIDDVIEYVEICLKRKNIKKKRKAFSTFGKLAMFAGAFVLMEIYTNYMAVASDLQFVDLRVAFIAMVAVIFNKKYSVAAAILCGAANVLQSLSVGYQWHVIFFNVNNWIPIALYVLFGTIIGIISDKLKSKLN